MADMKTRGEAARLLVYTAALAKDSGGRFSVEAAIANLFASETAMAVTTKCVQLYGGYGYMRDYPVERMMGDAKITEIYEGASEMQRMVVAGALKIVPLLAESIRNGRAEGGGVARGFGPPKTLFRIRHASFLRIMSLFLNLRRPFSLS